MDRNIIGKTEEDVAWWRVRCGKNKGQRSITKDSKMCPKNKRLEFRKSEGNNSEQCQSPICSYGLGAKDV